MDEIQHTITRPLYRFVPESIKINLEYTNLGSFNTNSRAKSTEKKVTFGVVHCFRAFMLEK